MSDSARRGSADVATAQDAPEPVDVYLADLDRLVAQHDSSRQDRVVPAIGNGTASRDVVRRVVLEHYYVGKWMAADMAVLIADAPDGYAFTMEHSAHYHHWAQSFADGGGWRRDPSDVDSRIEVCRQLGLGDDDIRAYTPIPETIATTFTMLYYVRRSYEEGLAVLGCAGERLAARGAHGRTLYDGLRRHYGVNVKGLEVDASAEPDHGDRASDLFRRVAMGRRVQERCRDAIRNCLLVAETRVRAMNRWIE